MSNITMPSGYMDMSVTELEYDGGKSEEAAYFGLGALVVGGLTMLGGLALAGRFGMGQLGGALGIVGLYTMILGTLFVCAGQLE